MILCPKKGEEKQIKAQVQNAGSSVALGTGSTTPGAGPAGSEAVPSDSSITPSITPVNQRGFSEFEVAGHVNNGEWRRLGRTWSTRPGRAARGRAGQRRLPRAPKRPRAGTGSPSRPRAELADPWLLAGGVVGEPHLLVLRFFQKNWQLKPESNGDNKGVPEGTWGK